MPARKKDPAAELAQLMLQVLEAQRRLGGDSYPLRLRRLAELADPAAPPELVLKAVGKKKPFGERAVVARPKDLDTPIALAEDAEQLVTSPLLLQFLLESVCTPANPTCDPGKLKSKLPAKLKLPFDAAVRRRIEAHHLPAGVAAVRVKKKTHLHLARYPLPKAPEMALAEGLVQSLREQRQRGGDAYPLTLDRLVALAGPHADAGLRKKAMALPVFKDAVLLAVKNRPDTPVALVEDCDRLADSPLLLETALRLARTDATQVFKPAELKKKVAPPLQNPLEEAIRRRAEARSLPPTIGCLLQKKTPLLFLLSDVGAAAPAQPHPGPPPPPIATASPPAPPVDFARAFDQAFGRLDRQRGGHNHVSLVDLRRAVPVDRPSFDAGVQGLRRAGRYTLSAAEGRHGISPADQEAGIYEDGSLLLYVSRRLS
jgi:hypothetical protein